MEVKTTLSIRVFLSQSCAGDQELVFLMQSSLEESLTPGLDYSKYVYPGPLWWQFWTLHCWRVGPFSWAVMPPKKWKGLTHLAWQERSNKTLPQHLLWGKRVPRQRRIHTWICPLAMEQSLVLFISELRSLDWKWCLFFYLLSVYFPLCFPTG